MPVNNTRQRVAYGLTEPLLNVNPRPILVTRPPTAVDKAQLGQLWIDVPNNAVYILASIVNNSATWVEILSVANITLTGDTGGPLSSSSFTIQAGVATKNSGSSVSIGRVGTALTLDVTDGSDNTLVGGQAGNTAVTGVANTGLGKFALNAITTGPLNTAIGAGSLLFLTTGTYNATLGFNSGTNYTGAESNNILILNDGVLGENNTLRLGTTGSGPGQQNRAFIAGINGVNVGSVATVVTQLNNQLGTAALTAGSNITITPTANVITIASVPGANVATTFVSDAGNAIPAVNLLNVVGAGGISTSGSGNTLTITSTGGTAGSVLGASINGPMTTNGSFSYIAPYGSITNTTQSHAQFLCPAAGTIDNYYVYVPTTNTTASVTFKVNKNGANTTMSITVPALTTGNFSDLVNSFTVVAGDLLGFEASASTGGTIQNGSVAVRFVQS